MKKSYSRFILWFIIILTAFAVLINMPKTPEINFNTPKLPGLNKSINIKLPIGGSTIAGRVFPFRQGLDLAGGTSVTLKADMKGVPSSERDSALDGAKTVLERRVNLFGVSEPTIQTAKVNGDYRLIVDLPGINVAQAVQLIGTTAQLTFWEQGTNGTKTDIKNLPLGMTQVLGENVVQTNLTGKDLKDAVVTFDSSTGKPQVQLTFTDAGSKKFADITSRNVKKIVAIALDNVVVEAPVVQEPILNGSAVISGSLTSATANQLAIELRAGALPVPLTMLQESSVGATLGQSSLAKSLFAGFIGFFTIVVFMIALYKKQGVIASVALVMYALFVLALFKLIPVVLTLAGIAGFILSIGMAVDANILIFERTKEELRAGRDRVHAITLGFSRAWPSIRDSNISTLITCFILYEFGTGIVRGFALTLAIGVLVSMFSAITVTRTLLQRFYK